MRGEDRSKMIGEVGGSGGGVERKGREFGLV